MLLPWVSAELRGINLKDRRLNARLAEVLSQLVGQPMASLPAACGGAAETMAADRLFDNETVRFAKMLEPHQAATRRRMAEQRTVVLVQDTTELDLTRPRAIGLSNVGHLSLVESLETRVESQRKSQERRCFLWLSTLDSRLETGGRSPNFNKPMAL